MFEVTGKRIRRLDRCKGKGTAAKAGIYFCAMSLLKNKRAMFLLLPFCAVLMQCSTYFNMFYNAEEAFREGYRIHAKAMRNFPDSIVTVPPPMPKLNTTAP